MSLKATTFCPFCHASLNLCNLRKHCRRVHPTPPCEIQPCTCSICFRQLKDNVALLYHCGVTGHESIIIGPFSCHICGNTCDDREEMVLHMSSSHRLCRCSCGKRYRLGREFEHYTDSPRHPHCNICETGFLDLVALKKHFMVEHRCTFCKKVLRISDESDVHGCGEEDHWKHCAREFCLYGEHGCNAVFNLKTIRHKEKQWLVDRRPPDVPNMSPLAIQAD